MLIYSGHGSDKKPPVTAISRLWNYMNKSRCSDISLHNIKEINREKNEYMVFVIL